jgi:hypothetical protein
MEINTKYDPFNVFKGFQPSVHGTTLLSNVYHSKRKLCESELFFTDVRLEVGMKYVLKQSV